MTRIPAPAKTSAPEQTLSAQPKVSEPLKTP
jgi:hypothetical protein